MLIELPLDFADLGAEDAWLTGFNVDWSAHTLTLEMGGASRMNESEAQEFDWSQGPTTFSAVAEFSGVTMLKVGWRITISDIDRQGSLVSWLGEVPCSNVKSRAPSAGWESELVPYGSGHGRHILSLDDNLPPRCFVLATDGLSAEWTALSVRATCKGPSLTA